MTASIAYARSRPVVSKTKRKEAMTIELHFKKKISFEKLTLEFRESIDEMIVNPDGSGGGSDATYVIVVSDGTKSETASVMHSGGAFVFGTRRFRFVKANFGSRPNHPDSIVLKVEKP